MGFEFGDAPLGVLNVGLYLDLGALLPQPVQGLAERIDLLVGLLDLTGEGLHAPLGLGDLDLEDGADATISHHPSFVARADLRRAGSIRAVTWRARECLSPLRDSINSSTALVL